MPRVTPGDKTQAAARKVEQSDKPATPTQSTRSRELMADNADEAQQQSRPVTPPKRSPARPTPTKSAPPSPAASVNRGGGEISLSSLSDQDDFMVLVAYGPAGTRKTTSALRVTKAIPKGDVLVIAAESGMKKHALAGHGVDVSRVRFWPPRGERVSYEELDRLFYKILDDLEKNPTSWAAVVWDSLTEVIQTLVDRAAEADVARLQEIARMAKKTVEVRPTYEREGSDYQVVTGQFRQLLRKFRSLPCHQIFVALEEDRKESVETDEGRKQKVGIIGPALTPMVRMDVEQHADVIIRMSVTDVAGVGPVGIGRSSPAEDLRAKDRYNVLPTVVIDPGWERVWAYVTGELKLGADEVQGAGVLAVAEAVAAAVESASEKAARLKEERAATAAARKAMKEETSPIGVPKGQAQRRSGKVTADSGTPENPPM